MISWGELVSSVGIDAYFWFSILSVGQTIIFIIFKKLIEDENLLESSHDNSDKTIEIDSSTIADSSAKILGLSSEKE